MRYFFPILMAFCFLLAGCQEQSRNQQQGPGTIPVKTMEPALVYPPPDFKYTPVVPAITGSTSVSVRYPDTEIPLNKVDFASYEDELSEEDWEVFTGFFPLLTEGETLLNMTASSYEDSFYEASPAAPEEATLFGLLHTDDLEDPPDDFPLSSFTLLDMTGDGQKELILYTNFRGGLNFVIHEENGSFCCIGRPIRLLENLQVNGIYYVSGGARGGAYHRLRFEGGTFREELLAERNMDSFTIKGEEASSQELKNVLGDWAESRTAGWYLARAVQE